MKTQFFGLLIFLVSLAALAGEPGFNSTEAPLASPYFVDEMHCSGINTPEISEGWLLSKEEVEPARKLTQEEMCERVLHAFGIRKFMWLSPDDLERTATIIRQAGYFQSSELSIRKSELQNHVHVFLKVVPGEHYLTSINEEFKYFGDNSGIGSNRLYDHLSAEISNRKYSPVSVNSFGFNMMGTTAQTPMNMSYGAFTSDDAQKMQKRNAYLVDIYWRNQGTVAKNISYEFDFHLVDDNTYSDDNSRLNMEVNGDLLFHHQVNIIRGSTYIGPAFVSTTYTPYQAGPGSKSAGVFFPGGKLGYNYGQEFANNLNFAMAYYHASGDQLIYDFDFNLQRHMNFLNSFLLVGLKTRSVNVAVMPEDRFPLSASNDSNSYVGLGKVFHEADSNQQVNLLLGTETLGYIDNEPTYQVSSGYLGLKYKYVGQTWNINLGASYYFQRLY